MQVINYSVLINKCTKRPWSLNTPLLWLWIDSSLATSLSYLCIQYMKKKKIIFAIRDLRKIRVCLFPVIWILLEWLDQHLPAPYIADSCVLKQPLETSRNLKGLNALNECRLPEMQLELKWDLTKKQTLTVLAKQAIKTLDFHWNFRHLVGRWIAFKSISCSHCRWNAMHVIFGQGEKVDINDRCCHALDPSSNPNWFLETPLKHHPNMSSWEPLEKGNECWLCRTMFTNFTAVMQECYLGLYRYNYLNIIIWI